MAAGRPPTAASHRRCRWAITPRLSQRHSEALAHVIGHAGALALIATRN